MLVGMIVTRTVDAEGRCRVYLGGKSSLEFWIEPTTTGWKFDGEDAYGANPLGDPIKRQCAVHVLVALAEMLGIPPQQLKPELVPFEAIEALNMGSPLDYRRVATPRKRQVEHGFMAAEPAITRPHAQFKQGPEFDRKKSR
jgi:hypothetical protein